MSLQFRSHLSNAALLLAATVIALAADRLSAAPGQRPGAAIAAAADVAPFVAPLGGDGRVPSLAVAFAADPFEGGAASLRQSGVASGEPRPTVPAARPAGRRLTAILIADERRVAVIDETTVSVGEVLADGARVSDIQPDRVLVVERNGRRQMLTLTNRGR